MLQPIIDSRAITHLKKLLAEARNIVITCHLSPDGDALGSTLALCRVLRKMGKDAHVVYPDQLPRSLQFLPAIQDAVIYSKSQVRGGFLVRNADLIFCLVHMAQIRKDPAAAALHRTNWRKWWKKAGRLAFWSTITSTPTISSP